MAIFIILHHIYQLFISGYLIFCLFAENNGCHYGWQMLDAGYDEFNGRVAAFVYFNVTQIKKGSSKKGVLYEKGFKDNRHGSDSGYACL